MYSYSIVVDVNSFHGLYVQWKENTFITRIVEAQLRISEKYLRALEAAAYEWSEKGF